MLIFFDTKFSDLSIDPRLISIGLISEDGREFYAELSDTYEPKDCGAFTQEAVLPHLQGGEALMPMHRLTLRLGNWLESFEQPVKLATDSLTWDWPWIQEIFSEPGTWPENLDSQPASLYQLIDSPFFERVVQQTFEKREPRLRCHHALDDAKANKLAYLAWTTYKNDNPLVMFSRGLLSSEKAIKAGGLNDHAELLLALGIADLPLPPHNES